MGEGASIPSASGQRSRWRFLALPGAAAATSLTGCSPPKRRAAVPLGRADQASVLGVPGEWATVERRAFGIATRAISTMVTAAAYNDAIRIYHITQRDSIDYNLAYIGRDFTEVRPEGFDTRYMRALFNYAYGKSSRAYDWLKEPSIL